MVELLTHTWDKHKKVIKQTVSLGFAIYAVYASVKKAVELAKCRD